jgi:hypothetical protein
LGRLNERRSEFHRRVTQLNDVRVRRLVGTRHLSSRREPRNHAFASEDHQGFHGLFAHNGSIRLPSLDQAEILQRPILGFHEMALDGPKRSVLHRQQKTIAERKRIRRGFGLVGSFCVGFGSCT